MKTYLYFETVILLILLGILLLAQKLIRTLYILIKTPFKILHNTADFYSSENLHLWQARKALEALDRKIKGK